MSFFNELRELESDGIDLIEVLGQDRHLESPEALQAIIRRLDRTGENLYTELLYSLTYRRFPPEEAEALWQGIMAHKRRMEDGLRRPVPFRVAALDYLGSERGVLRGVRLIARPEFESMLTYVNVDEVTAVYSRRYFNQVLVAEVNRARRYGNPLSLLLLDVDDFKQVNDREGHVRGDQVLRSIGRRLRDSVRQVDSVCRFGGDEFAIVLPETGSADAYTTADRVRGAVLGLRVAASGVGNGGAGGVSRGSGGPGTGGGGGSDGLLTASVGGATFPADCDEAEELVALADQMCLEAKRAGKDCVRLYGRVARAGEVG